MTSQECVIDAVLRAQGVLTDYVESEPRDCAKTLSRLFAIFADEDLTDAVNALNLDAIHAMMRPGEDHPPSPTSPLYSRTNG